MVREHLKLLGFEMKDRVTGFEGVVTSVCFDLYGCVQAILTPPVKDGKREESCWYDVKRLVPNGARVMAAPAFDLPAGLEAGGEAHPLPTHSPLP